jgi:hypothetical protein
MEDVNMDVTTLLVAIIVIVGLDIRKMEKNIVKI